MMEKKDSYIDVLGYKMRYVVCGKGLPVLLIHGFGTDIFSWRKNLPELSKYFRVYALDLIGFGRSDKPKINYSRFFFTKLIYRFLKTLKIDKATLIGASWGGALATSFTIEHPEKVDRLIVINSIARFGTAKISKARARRFKALTYLSQGKKSLSWARKVLECLLKEGYCNREAVTKKVVSEQFKMWKTQEARDALVAVGAQCKFADILDKNCKIDKKVLLIWGENDPYFPLKSARWLKAKIRNSKLLVVPYAGHATHETHPAIVNRAILKFLKKSLK
ncbi:alpha/beta fold hydrolase [Candidatus Omnitrophota bacterium]